MPADPQLNGPSGVTLDEKFLKPLGLSRDDAWLCDLVPHSCMNDPQKEAIARAYFPLATRYGLPVPTIPSVPIVLADEARRVAITNELLESQAEVLILLGDQPIREYLRFIDPRWARLSDFGPYGQLHKTLIGGKTMQVLPLVHPRQAGQLGRSSATWFQCHAAWTQNAAHGLLA
ncbi:MAG: hypothetical protein WCI73_05825 [Phycisphaerae bacterium]